MYNSENPIFTRYKIAGICRVKGGRGFRKSKVLRFGNTGFDVQRIWEFYYVIHKFAEVSVTQRARDRVNCFCMPQNE